MLHGRKAVTFATIMAAKPARLSSLLNVDSGARQLHDG